MLSAEDLRGRRAAAQLLGSPAARDPVDAVRRLLAVQAQDLRAARLALRARVRGLTVAAVDAALSEERSLVVGWLGRGTLHLVCAEDYGWLLALTAPGRLSANRRRLGQLGVGARDADRALEIVGRALSSDGPLTRAELAERIAAGGIPARGQAAPHLLMLAVLRGVAVLGPVRGDRLAFAGARDWLGPAPERARGAALAELGRRYLCGHGPASAADLATWAGLPLRDARAGLDAIAGELAVRDGGLVELATPRRARARARARRARGVRLLGAFDPYLLGWKDRSFAVPAEHARRVHPGGGIVRAVLTVDGLATGTWTARRRGAQVVVGVESFDEGAECAPAASRALAREIADVRRFLAA